MRVLVIGASGFVGTYLMRYFQGYGTSTRGGKGLFKFDLMQPERLNNIIEEISPELVINSSGMTNVDECEISPEKAVRINGDSVKRISEISKDHGAYFVQISTDYVFDGNKGIYNEEDSTNPINQYGKSKLVGEKYALAEKAVVLRISTPFGIGIPGGKTTFINFVIGNLECENEVRAVTDQFTTPTFVEDVGPAIKALQDKGANGIFHLGVRERISRYDFSIKIADLFELDKSLVRKASLEDFEFVARRPKDTTMNMSKISSFFKPNGLDASLEKIYREMAR